MATPSQNPKRWPTRKRLRLRGYDYSQPGSYFVTICTKNRKLWFGTISDEIMHLNTIGKIVQLVWLSLPERCPGLELDQFIVMPNHVHGLITLTEETRCRQGENKPRPTLSHIVDAFKETATTRIRRVAADFAWQQGFYDCIIRHERMMDQKRHYIATNPVRWQLKRATSP